jgi:predicted small integral membrane protein
MIALRAAKVATVAAIALVASLVTFGNLTDYNTNFVFVEHVLSMDTIYAFSKIKYRAITDPALHQAAYALIIATEAATAVLCWTGGGGGGRRRGGGAAAGRRAATVAGVGRARGGLLWRGGFVWSGGGWVGGGVALQWSGVPSAGRV